MVCRLSQSATSSLRKKSVDGGSAAIHWVRHVRNPLIWRNRISGIEPVTCPFFPNRGFFRTLPGKDDNFRPHDRGTGEDNIRVRRRVAVAAEGDLVLIGCQEDRVIGDPTRSPSANTSRS